MEKKIQFPELYIVLYLINDQTKKYVLNQSIIYYLITFVFEKYLLKYLEYIYIYMCVCVCVCVCVYLYLYNI